MHLEDDRTRRLLRLWIIQQLVKLLASAGHGLQRTACNANPESLFPAINDQVRAPVQQRLYEQVVIVGRHVDPRCINIRQHRMKEPWPAIDRKVLAELPIERTPISLHMLGPRCDQCQRRRVTYVLLQYWRKCRLHPVCSDTRSDP